MNKYAQLEGELLENHLASFLIDHWSISAANDFVRNEKSFEKKHIFRDYPKQSSLASIIGRVYHETLMHFFREYQEKKNRLGFDAMTEIAHRQLNYVGADQYRPQKGKTIAELQLDALKAVNSLVQNFLAEFDSYESEIGEIIAVELRLSEFVTINGIDIPIPMIAIPDVIFIDKQGYLCIFDHKAKYFYTPEKEVNLKYCNQSIGYALTTDSWILKQAEILKKYPKAKEGVKRFLFYENKYTQNRDKSRQIKQIPIDIEQSRQLYEQMLFEIVWRMMEAVQNPDYVYLMNPSDYFEDGEEIVNFWVKTHIEGLEGFPNLSPNQIRLLKKKRAGIRRASLVGIPKNVIRAFSNPKEFISLTPEDMENMTIPQRIEHRLATFNYPVRVEHVIEGYSCDTYLLQVNAGLKTSTIYGYRMDIANAIGIPDVRIAPSLVGYMGGAFVSIEVNRKNTKALYLTDSDIPGGLELPLGKDNFGKTLTWNIGNPSTPHLMIAGASGSGKSKAIQTIIEVAKRKGFKIAILDPKYEFTSQANRRGIRVINELEEIEEFMAEKVTEMDNLFKTRGAVGASDDKQLIIFDEAADCFTRQTRDLPEPDDFDDFDEDELREFKLRKRKFKTLEENTLILAQKARSAGIHLVLAAQRFSVKILSGDAKANFSTRLCLAVSSGTDSRVMIDQEGAEKLNGKGDALLTSPEHSEPQRIQCFMTK